LNDRIKVAARGVDKRDLGAVLLNPLCEGLESMIVAFGEEGVIYVADKNGISS
jgi:hypothetical protein